MSDTPRTDAAQVFFGFNPDEGEMFVPVDVSRQLELDLAEYRALLVRLYNDINVLHNGEAIRELNKKFRDENFN